jgi:5-methyltetrahydropteroyltriglutamate--homocysteine methyltransferase
MSYDINPPFRADHVGSLLRPKALLEAREKRAKGEISDTDLRAAEDDAIREVVKMQEGLGLESITDGEFRRTFFHTDFLEKLKGIEVKGGYTKKFHRVDGNVDFAPPKLVVSGKLERTHEINVTDFDFLKSVTSETAKLAIPSPTMVHFRGGRGAIDDVSYPDMDEFFTDLAQVYRQEINELAGHGCTYLQLDDTNLAYLCDPNLKEETRKIGEDPDRLPHVYAQLINECLADAPDGMTTAIHLCRGNFRSAWVAEGGYDPVAEVLFNEINVDTYFLEFDDERSGGFAPLRHVPENKTVVLGLISSKLPELESKDEIKARIDEASQYLDLKQLCLSPQCGFSSTVHGNEVSMDDQKAKLNLVLEIADEVWGSS